MPSDAVSSSQPAYDSGPNTGRDLEFWVTLVGSVDAVLRSVHGIREFTDDPDCVLRIAMRRARSAVTLSDNTRLRPGEPVGALHLWNEHLPRYSDRGPDIGWACEMRRLVLHSMHLLAAYVEREPDWTGVQAFCAETTLSNRLGAAQIRRLAGRYGFERIQPPQSMLRQLHAIGDCFNTWALTRAFNPAALSRQPFLRGRHELWISRSVLTERYGCQVRNAVDNRPQRAL